MKRLFPLLLSALLALPSLVSAEVGLLRTDRPFLRAKIIDMDPKGTHLRDAPKGKVIYVVPLKPKDEIERLVDVYGMEGDWFRVTIAESKRSGWMHRSVLGLRGGSAEDGPCPLQKTPIDDAPAVVTPKAGAVLQLLSISDGGEGTSWFYVRYKDAKGAEFSGWLPEQCQ